MTFALLSALTIAVGTVWRHQIVVQHDSSTLGTFKKPTWWLSLSLAWLAYGFQAVALAYGSLLVVQPVLVLSLLMTLLLAARVEGRHMDVDESFWATVLTVAVGALVIIGRPLPGTRAVTGVEWGTAVAVGAVTMVVTSYLAARQDRTTRAFLLGAICGAMFGYLAVFSKTAVDEFVHGGIIGLVTTWPLYALLASAVIGTVVQQYAFSSGNLAQSLPAMKVFEPLVAYTLGILLLGESFKVEGFVGYLIMVVAVLAMFAATFALSRKPA
ncbi:DMT family transporter [Corynebacterium aquatimens]|uniref:Drug/metabolite transporter (DMT)-like permease n=1 Tax=Corynebacterium aquatimens TaxID=1190508 RepID=A0A931E1L6_9CORY|nr:DMT family transporter [Corynebacterium aquatimens]MBG6122558.1 drug/metabolite transporter (DMT)-like permease [Corynebacterium aquatimens]